MINIEYDEIKKIFYQKYPDLKMIEVNPANFVFEQRVVQKCYHCKNYNSKWTCPPRTPKVDYPLMFSEYNNGAIIICELFVNGENFEVNRSLSTNLVHRSLLFLEGELYNRNESLAVSFIGGSCKLCKNGCNESKCSNPYLSRMPLEATGCNVVKSLEKYNINISFPIVDVLYRYGLLLW